MKLSDHDHHMQYLITTCIYKYMYMRVQCTLHVLKYTNCKARRFLCVHCTCMYMYIHVEYIAPAHAQLIHLSSN